METTVKVRVDHKPSLITQLYEHKLHTIQIQYSTSKLQSPRTETAQPIQQLATGRSVRRSIPGGSDIFRTRPDRPWGPPNLLQNGYWVIPGSKAAGALTTHPHLAPRLRKSKTITYLYSPSVPSWQATG